MNVPSPALRNVALVAHVDHGKTTLVDAMLRADRRRSRAHQAAGRPGHGLQRPGARAGHHDPGQGRLGRTGSDVKINLVDTPGHADFGGEVERALAMVDGVLLLVDAAEGPLPQTRYVLSKALGRRPAGGRRAQQGRPAATPAPTRCSTRSTSCSSTSSADDHHIEFPVISAVAREGRADARASACPADDADLAPLLDAILDTIPAPIGDPDAPLQALVTNLDASDYLGRLAIGRVVRGTLRRGEPVALLDEEVDEGAAAARRAASTQLLGFEGVGRDRGRRARRRRPVRARRLPRGRDRRHPRRPGRPRAAAPARASTSPCCA